MECTVARVSPEHGKCHRCRKFSPECGFDRDHGCTNLLCTRCADTLQTFMPDFPAFQHYKQERRDMLARMTKESA